MFFFLLFIVDSPAIEHSSTIDMSVSRAVPTSSRSIVRSSVQPLLQERNGLPLLMLMLMLPMLVPLLPLPMLMLMLMLLLLLLLSKPMPMRMLLLLDGARTAARWPTTDSAAAGS